MFGTLTIRKLLLTAVASLLIIVGYAYFATHAFVKLDVDTGSPAHFRLYWKSGEDAQFTESQSAHIQIYPDKRFYTAMIGDLRGATHLRVSPSKNSSLFRVTEVSIYQAGFEPIRFMGGGLKALKPVQGISQLKFDKSGMVYQPSFWDAYFEAPLSFIQEPDSNWTHIWRLIILLSLALLLARAYPGITRDLRYVPVLMVLVLGYISAMSAISRPHAHPDEHAHLQAALYYENHNIPPPACAEDSLHTYTNYGTSRLNTNELSYYITGKYLQLVDPVPLAYYTKLRIFNLGLFALLTLLAAFRPAARLILSPLLISPQFWYVFSYFNSDAFAIFTSLLIAYQLAAPDTLFKRFIGGTSGRWLTSFTLLSLLGVFLLLTKKNFYFFALFILGAGLVFAWANRHTLKRPLLSILGLALVSASAFGSWNYYQESIHGFDRSARVLECREQTAEHEYKPSTPLAEANKGLSRDKRGDPITELLEDGWAQSVFMSSFGNYSYVSLPASKPYYHLIAIILLCGTAYILTIVIRRGTGVQKWLLAGFIGLFATIIAVTLYKSWTVDYQAQGRYYFALIPMTGALLGWLRTIISHRMISIFILLLFAMGSYSFLAIALTEIRKVGF